MPHSSTTGQRYMPNVELGAVEPFLIQNGQYLHTDTNSYKVLKKLGGGGFAEVFLVEDKNNNTFALKVLELFKQMPQDHKEVYTRFRWEYKFCNEIVDYPDVVKAYDAGSIKNNPFYVMDYCPNGTLEYKYQSGDISESELTIISFKILKALQYLHSLGCIHRDLKPVNILFNQFNELKISDFGISAYLNSRLTLVKKNGQVEQVWMSLEYTPPERFNNSKAFQLTGSFTDIFSFGVVLYEVLSKGKFPFGDPTNVEKYVDAVQKGKYVSILNYRPNTSKTFVDIISKCLHSDYTKRFQSVQEILSLLPVSNEYIHHTTQRKLTSDVYLRIMNGEDCNSRINITQLIKEKHPKRILTIGWFDKANPNLNDIGLNESFTQFIPRRHATLEFQINPAPNEQSWFIRDGQFYEKKGIKGWHCSLNGVLVNSRLISQHGVELKYGDIITIGEVTIRVEI